LSSAGTISFSLTSGGTVGFAIASPLTGNPTDGETYSLFGRFQAASTSGTLNATYKNENYLQVRDYKRGILFETTDTTTDRYTISLRVNTIAGADTSALTDDSIDFDVIVTDSTGASVSGTPATTTINRNATAFGLTINGETLTFNTRLLDSLDMTGVKEGDEFSVSTIKEAEQVGRYGTTASVLVNDIDAQSNASVLMEVVSVSDVNQSVTFKATANILNTDGSTTTRVTNLTLYNKDLALNSNEGDALNLLGLDLNLNLNLSLPTGKKVSDYYKAGDKLVYNVTPQGSQNASGASNLTSLTGVQVKGQQNSDWSAGWNASAAKAANGTPLVPAKKSVTYNDNPLKYGIDASKVNGQDVHLKNFYINEDNGTVYTGDIVLTLDKGFSTKIKTADAGDVLASFEAAYVGQVAKSDVKLRDLNKFWSSEGRFLLADAQTLTITQGDGTRASVTLYATDTLEDVATKLNTAIAKQLNQQSVLNIVDGAEDPAANRFVTFVNEDRAKEGTSEALAGTFVIRSAITGVNGEISFAGDEDLIKQLSLNEIQASEENSFSVSVWDAHSGKSVASSVKITGNKLIGVINDNVDVVFDAMANVNVEWNEPTRSFVHTKNAGSYQTIVHLADNTTVFQVGANEGEDMGINIGDMRASALGLDGVLVTDRELAARSITIIDNAIDKVSTQRAKLGAYQNRLEHTITNLTVAGENLTAAESRIRDTDMAKEMMNFTKLQIMLQAGTSMLAQANQLPQNVLSLLR
jgi:flagellin